MVSFQLPQIWILYASIVLGAFGKDQI
jgi:hypothetical protein